MKIINAEIVSTNKRERISGGTYVEFLSTENVVKGDLFNLLFNKSEYPFEATDIKIEGKNLKVTAKQVGYWVHHLTRIKDFDLRTLIDLTLTKVIDDEEKKKIREQSCWC